MEVVVIKTKALRGSVVAALVACTGFGALGSAQGHPPREGPRAVWAGNDGLWVRATTGSFCWNSADGGICADSAYPLRVRGRLPVEPRERVRLRIRDHARRVHVSLVRVKSPR